MHDDVADRFADLPEALDAMIRRAGDERGGASGADGPSAGQALSARPRRPDTAGRIGAVCGAVVGALAGLLASRGAFATVHVLALGGFAATFAGAVAGVAVGGAVASLAKLLLSAASRRAAQRQTSAF